MAHEAERIQNILKVQDRLDKILKQNLNPELEKVRSYIQSLIEGRDGREFTKDQVEAIHEKLDILVMIEDIRPAERSDTGTPIGEERTSIRRIEALEDPKTELESVFATNSQDVEEWILIYLKDKLNSLKGEDNDNSFIKNLHIPAMLRLFGATNTRLDTIETKAGKIYSVPHGSHVTLKNQKGGPEGIQKRTQQSIKDVSESVKGKLDDEKAALGLKELSTDTYLTTYVSPISIQTRDMSVIENMRKATVALHDQKNKYIYNNIAIQSGFAMFEDYSMQ